MGGYRFNDVEARYTIGPQRTINGTLWAGGGEFFDGTRTEVGYRGRVEVTAASALSRGSPSIGSTWPKGRSSRNC